MLARLPTELKANILSLVRSHRDVLSLSLGCRSFHAMADLATRKKYHQARLTRGQDSDRLLAMIFSILRRPQLGEYVRHFEIGESLDSLRSWSGFSFINITADVSSRTFTDEEQELLRDAVGKIAFQDEINRERMLSAILGSKQITDGDGCKAWLQHALAALFISICPQLESLGLDEISHTPWSHSTPEDKQLLEVFLEDAATALQSGDDEINYLRHLREVTFLGESDYSETCYGDHSLGETFRVVGPLPSVERYYTDGIETRESEQTDPPLQSGHFRHISIQHSNISDSVLASVIASCRRLESFEYSIGGKFSNDSGHAIMEVAIVLNALFMHASTLQVLDLDVDSEFSTLYQVQRLEDEDEDGPKVPESKLTSMVEFTAMTRLTAGIKTLFALAARECKPGLFAEDEFFLVDHLPPKLESLCIRGYEAGTNEEYDRQVKAMMENRDRRPLLKEISGVDACIPNAKTLHGDPEDEEQEEKVFRRGKRNFSVFEKSFSS